MWAGPTSGLCKCQMVTTCALQKADVKVSWCRRALPGRQDHPGAALTPARSLVTVALPRPGRELTGPESNSRPSGLQASRTGLMCEDGSPPGQVQRAARHCLLPPPQPWKSPRACTTILCVLSRRFPGPIPAPLRPQAQTPPGRMIFSPLLEQQ